MGRPRKADRPKPPPTKMGRPAKVDLKKLASLMRMKPSLEDTAAFFDCSTSAISETIQREFSCTFKEFRNRHLVDCRHDLVREALRISLSKKAVFGKTDMLKFSLKNLADWADKVERIGEENFGDLTVKIKWADEGDEDVDLGDAQANPAAKKD